MSNPEEIDSQENTDKTEETRKSGENSENPTEVKNNPVEAEQIPAEDTPVETGCTTDNTHNSDSKTSKATNPPPTQEINQNGATINGQQANITGNIDKLHLFYGTDNEADFKDPTTPFPAKSSGLPDFDLQGELEKHYNKLEQERIILINCLDENVSLAASYAIAEKLEYYEKRMLSFSGENRQRNDLHVGIFTNENIKKSSIEKLVVFVSLSSSYSQSFFDSIFIKDTLEVAGIKQTFRENNIMLVCFVNYDLIRETLETQKTSFNFLQWNIWFLPHLLKNSFSDSEAKYFEKNVLEQKRYGLWGKNIDDSDFYKLIQRYLRNIEQFKEEVEKRTKYCEGDDVDEFLNSLQTVQLDNLFEGDDPLKKTVLYVVTFFPELSPHDFEQMVLMLLEDKKTTVYQDSCKENENGVEKTIAKPVEKKLTEIWDKNHRQILKDCYVKTVNSKNDSLIVDFSEPYLRGELKRYFKQEDFLYIQRQFEIIRDEGLLFNFDISDKIIENLITLSAEMAVSDPNYYGGERLVNLVVGLKQQELTNQRQTEIIIRISSFIRELLNYPQLKDMIKNFLEKLMQSQHHDLILVIVVGVTQRLQFSSQFDALYWIKRLLDQGQKQIKKDVYNILLQHAKQSGSRIYELLEIIKEWLPEPKKNSGNYSDTYKYMLLFFIAYCGYTSSKFKANLYGKWPSKYPLFATLQGNDDESVNKLKLLIDWIFHPGIQSVLDNSLKDRDSSDIQINANALRAEFLETWFTILLGFKPKEIHPEALSISNILLQQVDKTISNNYDAKTGKKIKQDMKKVWNFKKGLYLNIAAGMKERSQQQELKLRRKNLLTLKKRFK